MNEKGNGKYYLLFVILFSLLINLIRHMLLSNIMYLIGINLAREAANLPAEMLILTIGSR